MATKLAEMEYQDGRGDRSLPTFCCRQLGRHQAKTSNICCRLWSVKCKCGPSVTCTPVCNVAYGQLIPSSHNRNSSEEQKPLAGVRGEFTGIGRIRRHLHMHTCTGCTPFTMLFSAKTDASQLHNASAFRPPEWFLSPRPTFAGDLVSPGWPARFWSDRWHLLYLGHHGEPVRADHGDSTATPAGQGAPSAPRRLIFNCRRQTTGAWLFDKLHPSVQILRPSRCQVSHLRRNLHRRRMALPQSRLR